MKVRVRHILNECQSVRATTVGPSDVTAKTNPFTTAMFEMNELRLNVERGEPETVLRPMINFEEDCLGDHLAFPDCNVGYIPTAIGTLLHS